MPHNLSTYQGSELLLFEKARKWKRYFFSFIKPYIKKEVLEVGAGLGSNTALLNEGFAQKWILLEPDVAMSTQLKKKGDDGELPSNCEIICGTISQLKEKEQFDTIIYIDVLEHIEDDKKEAKRAAQLLKSGGHLIILSPAFSCLYSPFDKAIGHYRRYNKKKLKAVIPASLKKVCLFYLDSTGFFISMLNRILLKQKYPTQKQVNFWDHYGVPVSKIVDRIAIYSFGKTILGIWKKE
ncbi:MAG: class I SAM-dependent methyltransferase [Bacteroidota bacterium]|nr:class I SAM-dependent methyltransferase [Bacteroidota bacterium]